MGAADGVAEAVDVDAGEAAHGGSGWERWRVRVRVVEMRME